MTTDHQKLGILDYSEVLKDIEPGVRKEIYTRLLKGENGQPGLEQRFVDNLSQLRIFEANLDLRNRDLLEMADDTVEGDGPKSLVRREVASVAMQTANQRAAVNALGGELREIQKALRELGSAGT